MTRNRTFFAVALLVALLVAGGGSYYASSHPDGLNYVAQQTGFSDQEKASSTADGPFAGYSTTLLIGGGLFWALRGRRRADAPDGS
jgi:cobalt/nickel transport protein